MAVCASCATSNPSQAKFCLECGAALTQAPTGADRRPVTALFCDLVGSTRLGEMLDAEALRVVMREYYDTMRGALERHGGTVEKFIGDAVVAVFGVPVVHEDDALRAARAALDMHAAVPALNDRLARYGATLEIRIGMQSGDVVADGEEAPVGGDAFNTAARLQAAAGPGGTIVGEAASELLRGMAELEPVPPLVLDGKAEPVKAFRLISADLRRPVRTSTRLIGRDRALRTLIRAFEDAAADQVCILATVLGAPGLGKTRLAEELAARLNSEAIVFVGQTPAYGEGRTYAPVIDLLYAAAGTRHGDPEAAARALRDGLAGLPDGDAVGERLADLLGVGSGAAAGETPWAVRRLLERLAEERPLLVVLDDVHWADIALLELVDNVAERAHGPILLLCLARPELLEARPGWAGGKAHAVTMTLDALQEDAAQELAKLLLGGAPGDELALRIAQAAEGNPLYVEQYVATLAEGGAPEQWSVPPALQALLAARLDRLARAEADLLSTAAMQGHEFLLSKLSALVGTSDPADALMILERLERRDLVRRIDGGTERWMFAHGLMRDAAERRLPKQRRADLHVRLSELVAEDGGDDEVIGLHYERAAALRNELGIRDAETERLEQAAARHLAAAGNRAFARLDLLGTANLLGRAARLLPPSSAERLGLVPDLGVALAETGRPEEAVRLLEEAMAEASSAGREAERLRAAVQLLAARIYLHPTDEALEQARVEAVAVTSALETLGDSVGLAQAWVLVEYLGWMPGDMIDTQACLSAMEHARAAKRLREEIQAVGDLACYTQLGSETPDEIETIAARLSDSPDRIVEAGVLALRCVAAGLRGDIAAFRELDRAVLAIHDALGLEFLRATHVEAVAGSLIDFGEATEADRRLRDASETMRAIGDIWWEFELGIIRVGALLALDDVTGAKALADSLLSLEAPQSKYSRIVLAIADSRALLQRGGREEARARALEAVRLATPTVLLTTYGEALENLAVVETAHGREPDARAALEAALALYERKGSVPRITRLRAQLRAAEG
jgi:class 3 adenylate cyclase/tetratricopeptide (TPR) repeat protein